MRVGDSTPVQALDYNALASYDGVLATPDSSDCRVSINSGTPGAADTLSMNAGPVRFGSDVVTFDAQPVSVPAADDTSPRRDAVVGRPDGSIAVVTGAPEEPQYGSWIPEGQRTIDVAFRPAVPDLEDQDVVVLASVVTDPGNGIVDITDRRRFVKRERIDAEKSHVGSLSVGQSSALTFPDGAEQTQIPLYHAEDTDATTPLSFDTGQIPAYDEVIVRATVNGREDPGGSASFKKANLTVNNYTSANYKQNYISDSGFGTSAGKTSWVDGMYSGWSGMFEYKIEGDGANFGPTVIGRTSSNTSAESLYNGHIQSNQNPVSSVQFSTPFVATGKTTVVGVSY